MIYSDRSPAIYRKGYFIFIIGRQRSVGEENEQRWKQFRSFSIHDFANGLVWSRYFSPQVFQLLEDIRRSHRIWTLIS